MATLVSVSKAEEAAIRVAVDFFPEGRKEKKALLNLLAKVEKRLAKVEEQKDIKAVGSVSVREFLDVFSPNPKFAPPVSDRDFPNLGGRLRNLGVTLQQCQAIEPWLRQQHWIKEALPWQTVLRKWDEWLAKAVAEGKKKEEGPLLLPR